MATKRHTQRSYNTNRHHGKEVDPDELLHSISYVLHALRTGDGFPEDEHGDPLKPVFMQHADAVATLVDDVEALLGHMSKGGRMPTPWASAESLNKLAATQPHAKVRSPKEMTFRQWMHDVNRLLDDHICMISSDLPRRDWQAAFDNGEHPAEAVLRFYGDPSDKNKFLANAKKEL